MCSSAPDTSGINAAAAANANISKEALDWYKEQYAAEAPARDKAATLAEQVSQAQLAAMGTQTALAKDYADYNESTFRPMEQQLVKDAQLFDTEGKREELAGKALGDVNSSFDSAKDQTARMMARHGINMSDGSMAGSMRELTLDQSLAGAQAKNKARTDATTLGRAMKMDAVSLGRGLPSQQATAASLAMTAGSGAAGTAQIPVQVAQQGTQMMGQGFQTAIQGNNSAGNLYGNIANIQNGTDSANSGAMAGLGSAAGSIAMAVAI